MSGKSILLAKSVEFALLQGKKPYVATIDAKSTIAMLQRHIPGVICEVRGIYVVPHLRKK